MRFIIVLCLIGLVLMITRDNNDWPDDFTGNMAPPPPPGRPDHGR